jgi:hypothetical protein
MVAEALKATSENPLIVLVGGHLTDVASAVLSNPSITNRVRVFYIGGQASQVRDYNTWCDSWAFWIAASRFQMICFPIESLFSTVRPQIPFHRFVELSDNPLSRHLLEKHLGSKSSIQVAKNDLAMAVYLL